MVMFKRFSYYSNIELMSLEMKKNSYSKELLQEIAVNQSLSIVETTKAVHFLIEQNYYSTPKVLDK